MGASSSVAKPEKAAKKNASKRSVSAPPPLKLAGSARTPSSKKGGKHRSEKKRHGKSKKSNADGEKLHISRLRSASPPVPRSAKGNKKSEVVPYCYDSPKASMIAANKSWVVSAPRSLQSQKSTSENASLCQSDVRLSDSISSFLPCELRRAPQLELQNFREIVSKVNNDADAVHQRKLTKQNVSISDKKDKRISKPAECAAGGDGAPAGAEDSCVQLLKGSNPYVAERKSSTMFRHCAMNTDYSFMNLTFEEEDEGWGSVGDCNAASHLYSFASFDGESTADEPAMLQGAPEEKGDNLHTSLVPVRPQRSNTEVLSDEAGATVSRKGTFGLLLPVGKSVVIRQGGIGSFCKRENRRVSKEPGSNDVRDSPENLLDNFLTADYAGDDDETPTKADSAALQQLRPQRDGGSFSHDARWLDNRCTPPSAAATPTARIRPTRAAFPRSYRWPQPLPNSPRSAKIRSRPFNIEQVLGFSPNSIRRIPSPDWGRLDDTRAATSVPPLSQSWCPQQRQLYPQYNRARMNQLRRQYENRTT